MDRGNCKQRQDFEMRKEELFNSSSQRKKPVSDKDLDFVEDNVMRITETQIRRLVKEAMSEPTRPLYQIAKEIKKNWPKVDYAAKPYLEAMSELDSIDDTYIAESADSIVQYFLSNAGSWKGPEAARLKAELKALLKKKR